MARQRPRYSLIFMVLAMGILLALSGCVTTPKPGGAGGHTVTGAAGGETAEGQSGELERCPQPLGTASVFEDRNQSWWRYYSTRYSHLGSTIPIIRTMIQQSNCFVLVERGRSMDALADERRLMQSGELREGSDFGKGQMVAADYTISPSIQFSEQGTGGVGAFAGGLLRRVAPGAGSAVAGAAGGLRSNEAATTLLLVDNRSSLQLAAAVGNARNWDFGLGGGIFSSLSGGAAGYSNTPEGKVITAAFVDSYNQMVRALRAYRAQDVEGGMGMGGTLPIN
ncbi:CsgG/HfaB family protein [Desulfonatronum thioautotrophicum]|uniref:CsgG/HfaB family protein n=1 Tax=Desulfonatronum thioautotrophicum TaxID=617001 RepID=UPI0005EB7E51|nr:CsgG/HfaB family protein [Desulfonatronum thioautotrophicum]